MHRATSATGLFVKMTIALGIFVACAHALESAFSTTLLIASYGAMTALVFGLENERVARFRNVALGHLLASIIGVAIAATVARWSVDVAVVVAVSLAVSVMTATDTLHPPGGAIAMVAATTHASVVHHAVAFVAGITLLGVIYWAIIKVINWIADRVIRILRRSDDHQLHPMPEDHRQ